jgi:hypothetical protein
MHYAEYNGVAHFGDVISGSEENGLGALEKICESVGAKTHSEIACVLRAVDLFSHAELFDAMHAVSESTSLGEGIRVIEDTEGAFGRVVETLANRLQGRPDLVAVRSTLTTFTARVDLTGFFSFDASDSEEAAMQANRIADAYTESGFGPVTLEAVESARVRTVRKGAI